ncbi:MAG TPA: lamin tail domain-containing protein [Ktedonobacteraceae bacterium]|nr:lamin tail domain-containing protein [Ktedonobacteraceae bacterium]
MRLRLSFVVALLVLALLSCLPALPLHAASSHGCAPSIPPPAPGPLVPAPATLGIVVINEVLYAPSTVWNCLDQGSPSYRTDSWVELYNTTGQSLDLSASHASFTTDTSPYPYYFPINSAIPAHGYLVLFPDAGTSLLASGANLSFNISGVSIDQLAIPSLAPDQSYSRMPDGASTWQITLAPTIDASNTAPKRTPTPTSTHTPSSNRGGTGSGSGSGGYGGGTGYSGSTPTLANGTQTAWNKVQLPTSVPISTTTVNAPLAVSSPSPTITSVSDTSRRILLTILVVALA